MSPYWLLVLPGMWGVALLVSVILFLRTRRRVLRRMQAVRSRIDRHRAEMERALGRAIR